jgi:hypothetical protein
MSPATSSTSSAALADEIAQAVQRRGDITCASTGAFRAEVLMRVLVGGVTWLAVSFWCASASAQSLSRLVADLVFAEVVLAPGPVTTPPIPGAPHTPHFSPFNPLFGIDAPTQAVLVSQFRQVPELIRQANAQLATFPVGSSSGGFAFRFDPELGTFSRTSDSFGALLTERAFTLGRGHFSYGTVYQHSSYDEFEGLSLRNGDIVFYYPHNDCCPGQSPFGAPGGDESLLNPAFEGDVLRNSLTVDLRTETIAFIATAGVTNRLDIGGVVPIVRVALDAAVERTILRLSTESNPLIHSFDNQGGDVQVARASGTAVGVGDILLRAKYLLWSGAPGALALGGEARLPTGDETELLGTGALQGKLSLFASFTRGVASAHANVGYTASRSVAGDETPRLAATAADQFDFSSSPADEIGYAAAVDVAIHPRVTGVLEVTGRRLLDVNRLVIEPLTVRFTTLTDPVAQSRSLPALGLERGDMDLVLGAAGLKVNIGRTLLLNGGVLFPLTGDGLHNRTTATIGVDYTFGR